MVQLRWSVCNKGITQFLPATHKRTIPFLYSQPQSITAFRLVLIARRPPCARRDGQAELTNHQDATEIYIASGVCYQVPVRQFHTVKRQVWRRVYTACQT